MNKKGEAIKKIFDRLEKEPSTPKKLEDDLHIGHSTVMYALHDSIVAKIGIFKKLDDSGKYALKWYNSEENDIKSSYHTLKRKFLRSPSPEEVAGRIKRLPVETKDLLCKYIEGYREPTDEEVASAANDLWKMIVSYTWIDQGLPASKKYWFERGQRKVSFKGVDNEIVQVLLSNKPSSHLVEFREYFKHFPDMRPEITVVEMEHEVRYKFDWTEGQKCLLFPVSKWKKTADTMIPTKYKNDELNFRAVNEFGFAPMIEISEFHVPSQKLLDDLLGLVGMTGDDEGLLTALKNFCLNALDVEQLSNKMKDMVINAILNKAFNLNIHDEDARRVSREERELAFDIIEALNVREGSGFDTARRFVYEMLSSGRFTDAEGPDLFRVGKWLAEDSRVRAEIIKMTEEIMIKSGDDEVINNCNNFIKYILS